LLDFKRKQDYDDKKFLAAIQGVELEESTSPEVFDIADLKGFAANQEGFGVGQGIEVMSLGGDD